VPDPDKIREQSVDQLSQLRKAIEDYRLLLDTQNELIIKIDTGGKLLFVNKAYCKMFSKTPEDLLGKSFAQLIYIHDREKTLRELQSIFTAPYSCYIEQRIPSKNGYKWFGWSYNAVLDEHGAVDVIIGVGRDITRRKKTEETLRYKLKFERTIKIISSRFVRIDNIDQSINLSLADMGRLSGASRAYLFLLSEDKTKMSNTHEWCARGVTPQLEKLQELPCEMFPWWLAKLNRGEVIHIPDVSGMPLEAKAEKEILEEQDIKSLLVLPVNKCGELAGYIGLDNVNEASGWHHNEFDLLGVVAGIIGSALENLEMEKMLRQSEEQYRTIFENTGTATIIVENDRIISLANAEFEKLLGYSKEEIEGKMTFDNFFLGKDVERVTQYHNMRRIDPHSVPRNYEIQLVTKNRELKYSIVTVAILPGTKKSVASFLDITEWKRTQQELQYLSFHDSLTGLYNRTYFEEEMKRLENSRDPRVGLIMCDVDGLKLINDTLGHDVGDALLKRAANILKGCFRTGDVIARIGGDEFAILLPNGDQSTVESACLRVINAVKEYNASQPKLFLKISVGYAVREDSKSTIWDIFKKADDRMYREKLHHAQSTRSALLQTLIKALKKRDFIVDGHGDRLQEIILKLAEAINYSNGNLNNLCLFAQFHDIGKVGIPDSILFKEGILTNEEYKEMQRHSEIGYRIAQSTVDLLPIADWILKHHEWWNGQGYPLGLKGEDIPIECRILAIADAYDVMTGERPYSKAVSHEKAIKEIKKLAGEQFDPQLVDAFVKISGAFAPS